MKKLVIEAHRDGYGIDQIRHTMTVGELIEFLEQYDEDTPIYLGHDRWSNGKFYTYGGINSGDFDDEYFEEDDEDDECEDEDE